MKRTAWIVLIAGLSALMVTGCQQRASSVSTTPSSVSTKPAEAGAASEAANKSGNSQAAATPAVITQEEAGIKIRVDMPEIKTFLQKAKQGPIVPALKQNAIPQGMAYLEDLKWILVSYYREDGKPSLLTIIDAGTGKMVKALELYKSDGTPYTGHAGGITASRKHIWISSEKNVNFFNTEDILKADNGKLTFKGSVKNDTRASFTTYADGVLWIGEFAQGTDYPTDKSHYMTNRDDKEHRAWAVGYKLDAETDLPVAKEQGSTPAVPDYIMSLPGSIQGMFVTKDGIWLSQSSGRNNASTLHRFVNSMTVDKPHTTVSVRGKDVPVWFLDSKSLKSKMEAPPMSEGLFETNGQLYILFESGATKYRTSSSYALDRIQIMPSKE